jgi:hypothetical protein
MLASRHPCVVQCAAWLLGRLAAGDARTVWAVHTPAILVNLRCISTRVRAWFRCRDTAKIGKPWVVVNKPTLCRQKVRGTSCVATRLLLPRVMDLCGRLAGRPNYLVKGKGFLSVR